MVELGPLLAPPARPVVEPGGFPIERPFMDDPGVVPVVAEPPVVEPPPAVPPLLCASANVLESASAPANAIVMSFMVVSLVDDLGKPAQATDVPSSRTRRRQQIPVMGQTGKQCFSQPRQTAKRFARRLASGAPYFPSVGRMRIFHKFQMRSSTMKLILSPFSPSPGVR
jgi:hypothetical protein